MIQTVPKWRIEAVLSNGRRTQIWLSDQHIGNVLRTVSSMSFDANPLVMVDQITVTSEDGSVLTHVVSKGYVSEEPPNQ